MLYIDPLNSSITFCSRYQYACATGRTNAYKIHLIQSLYNHTESR